MSFFNPEIPIKEKVLSHHPWEKYIKDAYTRTYKYGHNSAKNPVYPAKKEKVPSPNSVKFTVIGNRITKEFIYCSNLVKGLHKYRWKHFDAPVIRGVTSVEWPKVWNDLKIQYGGLAFCLLSQVAILINDKFLGGAKELKDLIDTKYVYHIRPDYDKEAIEQFSSYIKSSGRPCAYLHISVDNEAIGTLIFMLYSDIVPNTCENFLRLCTTKKGGYAGTPVHRIVKDCWIQCGGYGLKNTELDCENFIVPHDRRGVLGMANDGRHIDCSTQFFVLLQPADWMAHKYVAFGQLIDGEETLQKLEQVPTWYESPTKQILIFKSGVLNLDCQDITINKETNKYIQGHIENLFAIGEIFYEALLEKVFLEADFRSLQRLQEEMVGEGAEVTPEEAARNIRATQRFMRKKEEIDKQLEKIQGDNRQTTTSKAATSRAATPVVPENNDFDVEEYPYEPEEYSYKHASISPTESIIVKPEKPFYLPLTDVPYPGEVDSTYDLKKVLKGDYCLDCDIDKDAPKKKKAGEERPSFPSELFDMFFDKTSSSSETSSQSTLDSDDEREIQKYLKYNSDRVSFAGGIVKAMAKTGKVNLFENARKSDLITTDEGLRRLRLASVDYRSQRDKKVSISLPTTEKLVRKEIKRRQTGFVRPEDLASLRRYKKQQAGIDGEIEEDDDEDDDFVPFSRQVANNMPPPQETMAMSKTPQAKARKTGFVPSDDLEHVHTFHKTPTEMPLEEEEEHRPVTIKMLPPQESKKSITGSQQVKRRQTGFVRPADLEKIRTFDKTSSEQLLDQESDRPVAFKIFTPPQEPKGLVQGSKFKRRQTGFVRPADLEKYPTFDKTNSKQLLDDEDDRPANFRMFTPAPQEPKGPSKGSQFKRRQTGFVRPVDLEKIHTFQKTSSERLLDEEDDSHHVRIAGSSGTVGARHIIRRPTGFVRAAELEMLDEEVERPSALLRLYDDVTVEEDGPGPTLKDYKPFSEAHQKNSLFLTASPMFNVKSNDNSREKFVRRSLNIDQEQKSIDHVLNLQHGKKVARKISSDYVKTIDHIEHTMESSIRSVEFAKTRPAISVVDYQKKNLQYHETITKSKLALAASEKILDNNLKNGKFAIFT